MRIYLRAKGGLAYGWGHIIRSLTLAGYLDCADEIERVIWGVEGDSVVERFVGGKAIPHNFLSEGQAFDEERKLLEGFKPDVILVDMLEIPREMLRAFRELCSVLVLFNDLGLSYELGDLIVCPQLLERYPQSGKGQRLLKGTDFFLLSDDIRAFIEAADGEESKKIPERLFVIMGGCVNRPVFEKVTAIVENLSDLELAVDFVVGYDLDVDIEQYRGWEEKGVRFIPGSEKIGDLMAGADLALASSGYVKYELAALGVPTILVSVVDHQEVLGRFFAQKGKCAEYVGPILETPSEEIAESIRKMAGDWGRRRSLAKVGRKLVDGLALERIKENILCQVRN